MVYTGCVLEYPYKYLQRSRGLGVGQIVYKSIKNKISILITIIALVVSRLISCIRLYFQVILYIGIIHKYKISLLTQSHIYIISMDKKYYYVVHIQIGSSAETQYKYFRQWACANNRVNYPQNYLIGRDGLCVQSKIELRHFVSFLFLTIYHLDLIYYI